MKLNLNHVLSFQLEIILQGLTQSFQESLGAGCTSFNKYADSITPTYKCQKIQVWHRGDLNSRTLGRNCALAMSYRVLYQIGINLPSDSGWGEGAL